MCHFDHPFLPISYLLGSFILFVSSAEPPLSYSLLPSNHLYPFTSSLLPSLTNLPLSPLRLQGRAEDILAGVGPHGRAVKVFKANLQLWWACLTCDGLDALLLREEAGGTGMRAMCTCLDFIVALSWWVASPI